MNKGELRNQMRVITSEGVARSNDLRQGLDQLELDLIDEGNSAFDAKAMVEELNEIINPHLDGFLNTKDPQPFYDVINASGITGMSQTALLRLTTNLADGIGGRPNDRNG